jgi:hypothetical protein
MRCNPFLLWLQSIYTVAGWLGGRSVKSENDTNFVLPKAFLLERVWQKTKYGSVIAKKDGYNFTSEPKEMNN